MSISLANLPLTRAIDDLTGHVALICQGNFDLIEEAINAGGGGGGTPGGSEGQIQINQSGAFGASDDLTFIDNQLRVGPDGTVFVGPAEASLNPLLQGYGNGNLLVTYRGDVLGDAAFFIYENTGVSSGGNAVAGVSLGAFPIGAQFDAIVNESAGSGTSYYAYVRADGAITADLLNPIRIVNPGLTNGAASARNTGLIIDPITGAAINIAIETGPGGLLFGSNAALADAAIAASKFSLWLDDTNGAAKLMVKGKSANGTVVTANIPLA